jgi:hypothetical protein
MQYGKCLKIRKPRLLKVHPSAIRLSSLFEFPHSLAPLMKKINALAEKKIVRLIIC